MKTRALAISLSVMATVLLTHCESTADNDVAEAQQCLNNINDSDPIANQQSEALICEQKISGVYTSESYVIRCAIDFIEGGITGTTLLNAVQSAQGQSGNQSTATLVAAIAQTAPSGSGLSNAQYAQQVTLADCTSSGVESLIFIAGLSLTGTEISTGGGIAACASNPSSCDPTTIGTTAQTMASSYCQGSNANSQACTIVNSAIAQGGGNPTTIGQNIINELNQ